MKMEPFEPLPAKPPAGQKRYKAVCRDPNDNPFAPGVFSPRGVSRVVQTVDVDEDTPREQVEVWAREAAQEMNLVFLELENVAA
jgi:hypothetical protein